MIESIPSVTHWNSYSIRWRSHGDSNPGIHREREDSGVFQGFDFVDKVRKASNIKSDSSYFQFYGVIHKWPQFGISCPLKAIEKSRALCQ